MEDLSSPLWLTSINFVGAINVLIIAVIMVAIPNIRRSAAMQHLIALLILFGIVSLMVSLQHARLLAWTPWREIFEQILTLLAGPLFLGYVVRSLTGRSPGLWTYLPLALFLVSVVILGESLIEYVRIRHLVWIQMAYSFAALTLILRKWLSEPGSWVGREHLLFFMSVMGFLHAGQIIRVLRPTDLRFLDIVPITLTLALVTILVYAVVRFRALVSLTREPTGEASSSEEDDLANAIERLMQEGRLYADPGLGVQELAAQMGVSPRSVSSAVNRSLGMSFPRYLTRCRLLEAERLLSDPKEARFTVEGIGRQAGFGSRSAFYRAFQDEHGESPAGYRKRLVARDVPK